MRSRGTLKWVLVAAALAGTFFVFAFLTGPSVSVSDSDNVAPAGSAQSNAVRKPSRPLVEPMDRPAVLIDSFHRDLAERNRKDPGKKALEEIGNRRLTQIQEYGEELRALAEQRASGFDGVFYDSGFAAWFSTNAQAALPMEQPLRGSEGTVAFWIQSMWEAHDADKPATFAHTSDGKLRVHKIGRSLRFEFSEQGQTVAGIEAPIDGWQPGEWHFVAGVWEGGLFRLFIDGKMVAEGERAAGLEFDETTQMLIGANESEPGVMAAGVMAQVRVFGRSLSSEEVQTYFRFHPHAAAGD